jgi:hypothetical protein
MKAFRCIFLGLLGIGGAREPIRRREGISPTKHILTARKIG